MTYPWMGAVCLLLIGFSLGFMTGGEFMKWLIKRQSSGENWLQWRKIIQMQQETMKRYQRELEKRR